MDAEEDLIVGEAFGVFQGWIIGAML